MKAIDIYNAWAPRDGTWSSWVKPVLFAENHRVDIEHRSAPDAFAGPPPWFNAEVMDALERATAGPHAYRSEQRIRDTALVLDLPSDVGVKLGIALAECGFRPVPLYNAAPGPRAIVDVWPIMEALERGVPYLANVEASAPPAFLLDADRTGARRRVPPGPGLFDNRSICRAADFPSAERFKHAGIKRIVLLSETLEDDLLSIALEWQAAGLELWRKIPSIREAAFPTTLRRPWFGQHLWTSLRHSLRQPHLDGLYGKIIDEPSSG